MLTSFDKALSALVVGLALLVAGHYGLHLEADLQAALATVVTGIVVYLVPNKQ
jgi:hypothetical protein